jgi:hypothetical protein
LSSGKLADGGIQTQKIGIFNQYGIVPVRSSTAKAPATGQRKYSERTSQSPTMKNSKTATAQATARAKLEDEP